MNLIHIEPQLNRVTIDGETYCIEEHIAASVVHPVEVIDDDPAFKTATESFTEEEWEKASTHVLSDAEARQVRQAHHRFLETIDGERRLGGKDYASRIPLLQGMIIHSRIDFSTFNCDQWKINVRPKKESGERSVLTVTMLTSAGLLSSLKSADYGGLSPRPLLVSKRLMLATYSDTGEPVDMAGNTPDPKDALLVHTQKEHIFETATVAGLPPPAVRMHKPKYVLTQKDAAEILGKSRSTVKLWDKGKCPFSGYPGRYSPAELFKWWQTIIGKKETARMLKKKVRGKVLDNMADQAREEDDKYNGQRRSEDW